MSEPTTSCGGWSARPPQAWPPRYRVWAMAPSLETRRLIQLPSPSRSDEDPIAARGRDLRRRQGVAILGWIRASLLPSVWLAWTALPQPGQSARSSSAAAAGTGSATPERLGAEGFPHTQRARVAPPFDAGTPDGRPLGTLWGRARQAIVHPRMEYVFLVIALAWGIAQVFIVPPLQVPDEGDHWFRAWALSDGQLTADRQGMVTLPSAFAPQVELYRRLIGDAGKMPLSLEGQVGFSSYEQLFNGPDRTGTVKVVSRVSAYGPVGYLPQAVGIALGRLAGATPLASFYMARLANLLAAVVLLFFAIRLAPFGKQLFVLLALLPMTMFELASVACDALTISGAMFFISVVLWASRRATLRWVDLVVILSAAALLLNVKPGYWALVLLVLLLRPAQLGGRMRFAAFAAANALAVAGVFLIDFSLTATDGHLEAGGGPHAQLLFILHDPLSFLAILWTNTLDELPGWTLETIGVLGWLRVFLPMALYLFVVVAAVAFVVRMREEVDLEPWRRVLLAAVGALVFLTMAVALYAFLEPTGSQRVFFQGRYLAPVWLLLLLSIYGMRFAASYRGVRVVFVVALIMMASNLQTLMSTYHG